jgi:hypothetical protein
VLIKSRSVKELVNQTGKFPANIGQASQLAQVCATSAQLADALDIRPLSYDKHAAFPFRPPRELAVATVGMTRICRSNRRKSALH